MKIRRNERRSITHLELIKNSCDEQVQVTWLDYPLNTMGEGSI